MSVRLKCRSCQTAFVIADDQAGGRVTCPKCGVQQVAPARSLHVPKAEPAAAPPAPEPSAFVAADAPVRPGRLRKLGLGVLMLLAVAAVAVAVAWPSLKRWWHPIPPDPVEVAAGAYLQALAEGDYEAAHRLGTVDEPPAIRSFRDLHRQPEGNRAIKGSFAPLAGAARADRREVRVRSRDRPVHSPRSPGTGGRDARRAPRRQGQGREGRALQEDGQRQPGRPLRCRRGTGRGHGQAGRGRARSQEAHSDLQAACARCEAAAARDAAELALDFAAHRESWDALLKRPFPTLKADGPFRFEHAVVTATVRATGLPRSAIRRRRCG